MITGSIIGGQAVRAIASEKRKNGELATTRKPEPPQSISIRPPFGPLKEYRVSRSYETVPFLEQKLNLGSISIVGSRSEPVEPWDCLRWPNSPYCDPDKAWSWRKTLPEISILDSRCDFVISTQWRFLGFSMPTLSIGIRKNDPRCQDRGDLDEAAEPIPPPLKPQEIPPEIDLNNYFMHENCDYIVIFHTSEQNPYYQGNDPNLKFWRYRAIIFKGKIQYSPGIYYFSEDWTQQLPATYHAFKGVVRLPGIRIATINNSGALGSYERDSFFKTWKLFNHYSFSSFFGYSPQEALEKARNAYREAQMNENQRPWDRHSPSSDKFLRLNYERTVVRSGLVTWRATIENKHDVLNWQTTDKYEFSNHYLSPGTDPIYFEYPMGIFPADITCQEKYIPKPVDKGPYPMKECCGEENQKIIIRYLKRISAVLQPEKFREFKNNGDTKKIIGKAPNSMIFPQAKGNYEIGGYDDLAIFLVRYLDRVFGTMPISATIKDIDPNTPGDQSATLQFQSISAALSAIVEAQGSQFSLLFRLGDLIKNSELELELLDKIAVSGLMETGLCHQILVQIAKRTEAIADYMDFKVKQTTEKVPFAFDPLLDPPSPGLTEQQYDDWVRRLLKPSEVEIKVEELDYKNESKLLSDYIREIDSGVQSIASKNKVESAEDLKNLIAQEKMKLDIEAAYLVQLLRKALGLPGSVDLDRFSSALADLFQGDKNLSGGLMQNYPASNDEKPRVRRATKGGKRANG